MPDEVAPPTEDFPALDEVQSELTRVQADPLKSAEVIRNWRTEARKQLDSAFTDPEERGRATDKLDDAVGDALKQQQTSAVNEWTASRFGDPTEAAAFRDAYLSAGGDHQKLPEQFRGPAADLDKIATAEPFQPTRERRNALGSIMAGQTKIGAYTSREAPHTGQTEAYVTPINSVDAEPGLADKPKIRLSVPTPTEADLKAESERLNQEADTLDERVNQIVANPDDNTPTRDLDEQVKELRKKAATYLSPAGKQALTDERIRDKLKSPEYQDKIGQYAGGQEFYNGLQNAVFSAGALVARAHDITQGGDRAMKLLEEARQEQAVAQPGSTRRTLEGGFANEQIQAGQRMAGEMAPYMAGAGLARAGIAGAEKLGLSAAARELAVREANKSGIGAIGAGMGAGMTGTAELDTQQKINEAEAAGDTERAKTLRAGRDAHAVISGIVMGGFSKMSPLHNFQASGNTAKTWAADILKQSLEMPAMTTTQGLLVDPIIGEHPDVIGGLKGAAVQGAGMALLMGGVTRIGQRLVGTNAEIAKNQQKATELARQSGAADPETLANIETIHEQQRQNAETAAKQEAAVAIQQFKATADQMQSHNAAMDVIKSAPDEPSIPREPPAPEQATPEEKQLADIRAKQADSRALELKLNAIEMDESLTAQDRMDLREPILKEKSAVESDLVKLQRKLEPIQQAMDAHKPAEEPKPKGTSDEESQIQKEDGQGQEGQRRRQDEENEGLVPPAAPEAQVEPPAAAEAIPPRDPATLTPDEAITRSDLPEEDARDEHVQAVMAALDNGKPVSADAVREYDIDVPEGYRESAGYFIKASPEAAAEPPTPGPQTPAAQSPPEQAAASGPSSDNQASVDPNIRQPWVNNALKLAAQGKDQRGPLANALKAMTIPERAEAAKRAGVVAPTLDDHILLAREMSDATKPAGAATPPPPPQTPEQPWGTNDTTGIKNEVIDQERRAMGLEPMAEQGARIFGDLWVAASDLLAADPQAGYRLVEDLRNNPRPHNDGEAALLLRHKIELEHAAQIEARKINAADSTASERELAATRRGAFTTALADLHEAARLSGTETGRALNARKLMVNRDNVPTWSEMVADRRTDLGREMTPEETAALQRIHSDLEAAGVELKTAQEAEAKATAAEEMQAVAEQMVKDAEPAKPPRETPKVLKKIIAEADAATERLRKAGFFGQRSPASIDPLLLKDLLLVAGGWVAKGADTLLKFTERAKQALGDVGKDLIEELWTKSSAAVSSAMRDEGIKAASQKARTLRGMSPDGVIAKTIADKAAGETVSPRVARALLEAHIRDGVTGVDDLTAKVRESLKKIYPEVTDRDVWDAVTGYGKVSKPSQDAIKKSAAEYRSQMLLIRKLEAAKAEEAILKTGPQRERASEKVRQLQRELNEVMRKSGYNASSEGQVRGRLDAIKQGLRNQIEDLESIIAGRQKIQPKGLPVEVDAETKALKARLEGLREHLRSLPEFKAQLDAAENTRAIAAAKASRDEYTRRIREKEFESSGRPDAKVSAELRRMRAERDVAAQQYRDARASSEAGKAAELSRKVQAATKAVEAKEQALIADNWAGKNPGRKLSDNPELKLLQERAIELNNELRTQRHGDGMEALKNWADQRKKDLQDRLNDIQKPKKPGLAVPHSPEADAIRAEIKAMEDMVKAKEAPAKALKSIRERIKKLQKKVDEGDLSRRTNTPQQDTPEVEKARKALDDLQEIYDRMVADDGTRANEDFRKRLDLREAKMNENIAAGFPEKAKKAPLKLTGESEAAQAKFNAAKYRYDKLKMQDELAKREWWSKGLDAAGGINRAFKLSRLKTNLKLVLYSLYKLSFTPITEAVGAGVSKVMPELSRRANIEGGGSIPAISSFYRGFFGRGMYDAAKAASPAVSLLTRGRLGDIDSRSPMKSTNETEPHLPPRWWDIPQISHEVLKSPLLRGAFEMAKTKLRENMAATGTAMSDAEVNQQAYTQAKRAILMSDNRLAGAINRGLKALEEPSKASKRTTFRGKLGATAARTLLTFNRVASNHFVELFNNVAGLPIGLLRSATVQFRDAVAKSAWEKAGSGSKEKIAAILGKSLSDLHPEDANSIIRQLKTGSVGLAMLTLGMLSPQTFGGMNFMRKHGKDEPGFGEIMVGGIRIPKVVSMAFAPLLAAQIGATITQTAASKLKKADKDPQGFGMGLLAGAAGVAESGPIVNEAAHFSDLMHEHGREKWIGNWIKGNLIPGGLDELAQALDQEAGVPVKRSTHGTLDSIMSAIPGLRSNLPAASDKRRPAGVSPPTIPIQ